MNEEKYCYHCGCLIEDGDYTEIDGKIVCSDCLDTKYRCCECCCEYNPEEEVHEIYKGYRYGYVVLCEDCLEENTNYFKCDDCGEWFYKGLYSEIETDSGNTICQGCYEDHYITCADCGRVVYIDDATYSEDQEEWFCGECWSNSRINSYCYKPEPKCKTHHQHDDFKTPRDIKDLLLGVELEIDDGYSPRETSKTLCDISEDIYIKRDGSLSDDGMEIVSHPCTLEYHMESLGWDKICSTARMNGYLSHDSGRCGLHVHVGRHQLGETSLEREETVAKIVVLVERHWEFIKRFSRRNASQIEDWAKKPNLALANDVYTEAELVETALGTVDNGRYMAVNLQNRNTIEFRIFNGTLKYETLIATLQLVHNLCTYAQKTPMSHILYSRWQDFVNMKYYGALQLYVKGRGLNEMENPNNVRLLMESAAKKVPEINIGDVVQVVNNKGYGHEELRNGIGEIGRVVAVRNESECNITVRFERRFTPYLWAYTSRSGDIMENCYNVDAQNLRVLAI